MNRENIEAVYKLSAMQEGILFHNLLSPGTGSYVEQTSWPWKGTLDMEIFRQVWLRSIEDHAVLRTSFLWEDLEQPVQVVHRKVELPMENLDWSDLPAEQQERQFNQLFHKDRLRNFDLKQPPLLRLTIIQLGPARFQIILTYHHVVMDGWSSDIVVLQVQNHYAALSSGRTYQPPRSRPFRDYLRWIDAQDMGKLEEFWRLKLAGITAPTGLNCARKVTPHNARAEAYAQCQILTETGLMEALIQKARQNKLTPYTLVLAAWSLLLHRYSGESRVLFASTSSGRALPIDGIENMIGLLINTLPNVVQVPSDQSLLPWLQAQQSAQMRLTDYEYTPLTRIRDWSDIPRELPFLETILIYQNFSDHQPLPNTNEKNLGHYMVDTTTNFPLSLLVYPCHELLLRLNYDTRRFSPGSIERILGHLQALLMELTGDLNRTIGSLSMLTQAERTQILQDWNRTERDFSPRKALIEQIQMRAADRVEHPAVSLTEADGSEATIGYGDLLQLAGALAAHLAGMGVGPGEVVAVCCERGLEMMVALLGTMASGAAYLPLDPAFPRERLRYMLTDSGARVLLTEQRHRESMTEEHARIVTLTPTGQVSGGQSQTTLPPLTHHPQQLAYVIYTSGSTGKPKGVMISQGALINFMHSLGSILELGPDDRLLAVTTISFDIAALEIFLPLLAGASVVLANRGQIIDGDALAGLLRTRNVTFMQATPATWRLLLASGWQGKEDLKILCGGEALPRELAEQLLGKGREVWNLYGPTETTIWSGARRIKAEAGPNSVEQVGPPIHNTGIYILDNQLQPAPIGIPGKLYISGAGLARGYHGRPALTAASFLPHPFAAQAGERIYHTGDLGAFDEDGTLEFLGRSDHQIKLRGFRIELGEIDAVLCRHELVENAATVLRDTGGGDTELVCYFVAREGTTPDDTNLRAFLAEALPAYMVPARFVALDEMPLNTSGKINRKALPEVGRSVPSQRPQVAPRNETERTLAAIWKEILKLDQVGVEDNFFDLGGHSLRLVQVRNKVQKAFQRTLSMVELFRYTSIAGLAAFLQPEQVTQPREPEATSQPEPVSEAKAPGQPEPIAVIGMTGRFPGAANVARYWENLAAGTNALTYFSREELIEAGVKPAWVDQESYVRARGYLDDIEMFDAAFFGMTPRDAEVTDPQHRLFLEGAWEALEDAGYNPETYAGRIGVFAGAAINTYAFFNLMEHPEATRGLSWHQLMISNDQSFITTRVSYKLNLKGPSMGIQTACSTSLVAVAQACQSLSEGRCKMALAGGVAVNSRQKSGYFHEPGGIVSADGHCRPFEARANGTVFGSGMGIVVLKRLSQAQTDGDTILAIIKGCAVNNDGSAKAGYTAPSVEGQVQVIQEAQTRAGVAPESIGFIETHGTGTALGDPIEIAALTSAFRARTEKKAFCALGSVKAAIGHLDTAAGAAGLIKSILALQHGQIPPSPYFKEPNPEIDFEGSPFFINPELQDWKQVQHPAGERQPRRAAVSSFGIGGTNAHIILEEAPERDALSAHPGPYLLPLSAQTPEALAQAALNLSEFLERNPEAHPAEVAYTLQVGRAAFAHRAVHLCDDRAQCLEALRQPQSSQIAVSRNRPLTLLFTGQGSQYPGMGWELYQRQPVFRHQMDRCAELLRAHLELDLREVMYPGFPEAPLPPDKAHDLRLAQTSLAQPALFVLEYALARMWFSWGIEVRAMVGHSIGEYVAACLAGVFSLEDALMLVATRGRLMQAQPPGAMLAVALPALRLLSLLGPTLELAAINGASRCVVGGSPEAISLLESVLARDKVPCSRLVTSHAFHTAAMDGAVEPFLQALASVAFHEPKIPFLSNATGTWITPAEATDPRYWAGHLRQTVRFDDCLSELLREENQILLELGPGETLATLTRGHRSRGPNHLVLASLPKQRGKREWAFALKNLGLLWQAGGSLDWSGFNADQPSRRLRLPTYPFQRQRFWVDGERIERHRPAARNSADHWYYLPGWKPSLAPPSAAPGETRNWLVFNQEGAFGERLISVLRERRQEVVEVTAGSAFEKLGGNKFAVRGHVWEDYRSLAETLHEARLWPDKVLHLWNLGGTAEPGHIEASFHSPLLLAKTFGLFPQTPVSLAVVADHLFKVDSGDRLSAEKATLAGPVKVANREFGHVDAFALDVVLPPAGSRQEHDLIEQLLAEMTVSKQDRTSCEIAYRGQRRLERLFQGVPLPPRGERPPIKQRGIYLITGGLGGIGQVLAHHLAEKYKARLVLTSRSGLPDPTRWQAWLADHPESDRTSRNIRQLQALEHAGGEVYHHAADVSDPEAMAVVFQFIGDQLGGLDGVIHAAGIAGGGMIQLKSRQDAQRVLAPKVEGTLVLAPLVARLKPDFWLLCSSVSAVLGEIGQVDYCAANAFMDAFAEQADPGPTRIIAVNWGAWREVGMAVETRLPENLRAARDILLQKALSPQEGIDTFERLLAAGQPRMLVSPMDIHTLILENAAAVETMVDAPVDAIEPPGREHPRPNLASVFVAPHNEIEAQLARIWQRQIGIDKVGVDDNFFELGGDSLLGLQVVAQINRDLGVVLTAAGLYEAPTVRAVARLISPQEKSEPASFVKDQTRGSARKAKIRSRKKIESGTK